VKIDAPEPEIRSTDNGVSDFTAEPMRVLVRPFCMFR
jgi:hypothetical protein